MSKALDKLPDAEKQKIKKASTDRLKDWLVGADFAQDEVEKMDRETLMETWAQVTLTRLAKGAEAAVADPESSKLRLEFEKYRFDQQMELEKAKAQMQLQVEIERQKQEAARLEFERQKAQQEAARAEQEAAERRMKAELEAERLAFEKEKLRLQTKLERAKMEFDERKHREDLAQARQLHEDDLNAQQQKEAAEKERRDSAAGKTKRYADALRGVLPNQSDDAIEALTLFQTAESLFRTIEVPDDLQGILIRPFLNSKCKSLVSKLDQRTSHASYVDIKALILKEYKLSPAAYKDLFNSLRKNENETYVMYMSRLRIVFEAYLDSRKVNESFQTLSDLILADRLKGILNEHILKHVVAVESSLKDGNGWLSARELAEAVDTYCANYHGGKSISGNLGAGPSSTFGRPKFKPMNQPLTQRFDQGVNRQESTSSLNKSERLCYICKSNRHLARECPNKGQGHTAVAPRQNEMHTPRRANSIRTTNNNQRRSKSETRPPTSGYTTSRLSVDRPSTQVNVALSNRPMPVPTSTTSTIESGSSAVPSQTTAAACMADLNMQSTAAGLLPSCDVATLHYVDVGLASGPHGDFIRVRALEDSGAELAVARTSLLSQLPDLETVGSVHVRGVIGRSIECKLVRINVCLLSVESVAREQCERSIRILCAVSDDANDQLLLPASIVDSLREFQNCLLYTSPSPRDRQKPRMPSSA